MGRRHRKWWFIGFAVLAGSYVMGCVWIVLLERSLTYHPDPTRTAPSAARLAAVTERELQTTDGERLVVWRLQARPGKPTLLYFHGNGDPLSYRSGRIASFEAEGWGVFMMAYRGYAGSTGQPTEAALIRDALLAYDTLVGEGVPPSDIILYGESLGTNVALRVAVDRPAAALILESPFTSMVDAWRQYVPMFPVRRLLTDQFDSLAIIGRLEMPLLILHGARDRLVSLRLGTRLFAAAPEPKRLEVFPEAGHSNLYAHNAISAVRDFVARVRSGERHP